MKTIAEVSRETLIMEAIIKGLKPGEHISYDELQNQSGIIMDAKGKSYMRSALHRLKIEYTTINGVGITTASAKNSSGILSTKAKRVDNSIHRAEKTTRNITTQFYSELENKDKAVLNDMNAKLGTLRLFSKDIKMIFKKDELKPRS